MNNSAVSIAVIGNCQSAGLASAIRLIAPSFEVQPWHLGVWPLGEPEEIAPTLMAYDYIVFLLTDLQLTSLPILLELKQQSGTTIQIPPFVFAGFHPDCIALSNDSTRQVIPSPYRDQHSLIIACSYILGLTEHRVLSLFNRYVYESMGYLHSFSAAKEIITKTFQRSSINLSEAIESWVRQSGSFMWIPTHPKKNVFLFLAEQILSKLDLEFQSEIKIDLMPDHMENDIQFPIFPEIAAIIDSCIPSPMRQATSLSALNGDREHSLAEQIHTFYKFYSTTDSKILSAALPTDAIQTLKSLILD
jgi:hypothetical protein